MLNVKSWTGLSSNNYAVSRCYYLKCYYSTALFRRRLGGRGEPRMSGCDRWRVGLRGCACRRCAGGRRYAGGRRGARHLELAANLGLHAHKDHHLVEIGRAHV